MAKYLCVVPSRFAQIALSTETLLDMSTLSIEDVTGRLKAVEDQGRRTQYGEVWHSPYLDSATNGCNDS